MADYLMYFIYHLITPLIFLPVSLCYCFLYTLLLPVLLLPYLFAVSLKQFDLP